MKQILAVLGLLLALAVPAQAAEGPAHVTGSLNGGSTYVMDVPARWNGTVLLWSHGLNFTPETPTPPNPAQNAPTGATQALLDQGYALIGSSYVTAGWVVATAVPDQVATLAAFQQRFGRPKRTIAWGGSMGGLITTKLNEDYGSLLDGSVSLCGAVMGGPGIFNSMLDVSFALRTLIAPELKLVDYTDRADGLAAMRQLAKAVTAAQATPEGRARIALAAALYDVPGYNDPSQTRPAPGDAAAAEVNQFQFVSTVIAAIDTAARQDTEGNLGGNPSWNTGVDYRRLLGQSRVAEEVGQLYSAAGLSLHGDLDALAAAPRISANPAAKELLARSSALTGRLTKPQITLHTTGDGLVPIEGEQAYRQYSGDSPLLRQTNVDGPGHCAFALPEVLAGLKALEQRLDSGRWGDTGAAAMNARARAADPTATPRFTEFKPGPYQRPYQLRR
ncbi:alpha/beta hydrolase [Kutzneria viridogrisea]|uniref:Uncharacterized protein n=1 Tax=Kutzneria viridogrisea TaxID=47990 RepID=A0ABR6B8C8_9PSEU|nr:hypothetical protein [Kutzneria viridogrisea]